MLEREPRRGEGRTLKLCVPQDRYSQDAVLRTAYLFTGRCYVRLLQGPESPLVEIAPKTPDCDLEQIAREFHNELIDQELRERIRNETHHIQEMIVREAFAPLDTTSEEK